jgi:nucleoside-diphosphate-sugar epimerase
MNILLSGASGFIGSYFINRLIDSGDSVDIISRKKPTNLTNSKTVIYDLDITKPNKCILEKKYDVFIHLAGANDVDSRDPFDAVLKTTYGTRNCLDLCLKNKITKFVYFSTLQVYGDNKNITENSEISCQNDYAMTHYFSEEYVRMFQSHGIDFIILRPSNVYGDFQSETVNRWSLVPGCFCKSAIEDSQIILLSSGRQKRDFVCLEDVYMFTTYLIKNFALCKNEIYNLASGDVHSILELAELVKERFELKCSKKCDLVVKSELPMDDEEYRISLERMKNTGYEPIQSSLSTIQTTIDNLLEK